MIDTRYDYLIGTANNRLYKSLTVILAEAGFYSAGSAENIPVLLRKLRRIQPWLVVVDTALPPGNIEELAEFIDNDALAALLFINTTGSELERYVQLAWPVEAPVLTAVAKTVCSEFTRKKKLQQEVETLHKKLNERKLLDRAKGLLINLYAISEEEAFQFLRKTSMQKRLTIAEMADLVIKEPDLFSSLKQHR
ncbi:MAG: ANTAR domain-containing response regulator [Bacillota bacterium]